MQNNLEKTTTSPIEFVLSNKAQKSLGLRGEKIFVDNFNRIALAPEKMHEGLLQFEGIDVKFSSRIKYNYPTLGLIESLTGKRIGDTLIFDGLEKGRIDESLGRLRDYYEALTPEVKNSINKIVISSDKEMYKYRPDIDEGDFLGFKAFMDLKTRDIFFREQFLGWSTFRHESTHVKQFEIEEKVGEFREKFKMASKDYTLVSWDYWNLYNKNPLDPKLQEIKKDVEKLKAIRDETWNEWQEKRYTFSEEWKKIADVKYDKIVKLTNFRYEYKKPKGNEYGFEYGLVMPYGGLDEYEDGATFVQAVIDNPKELGITIGLNQDARYLEKLNYLYQKGFISKSEYEKVMFFAE